MWLRRIFRSGDSLAVSLPAAYCRDRNLRRGDYVELRTAADGSLLIHYGLTTISERAVNDTGDRS